jgi:hypothetical protein
MSQEQKATPAEPPGVIIAEPTGDGTEQILYPSPATPRTKRKKRYSKGTKDLQRLEGGVSKATWRIAHAVTEGVESYRKRSKKAARKRRDGALRDFVPNVARAVGDAGGELAKAPADFIRQVPTKLIWRQTRAIVRVVTPLAFLR